MRTKIRSATALILGLVLGATGCGPARPAVAPVSGTVSVGGVPVKAGIVYFYPTTGRLAVGEIGPDGRYSLATFAAGDGAILGDHRVVIEAREVPLADIPATQADTSPDASDALQERIAPARSSGSASLITWVVPEEYAAVATTPLRVTVQPGRNVLDFALPPPSARPEKRQRRGG